MTPLALLTFVLTWLVAGVGLVSKTAGSTGSAALPLRFPPFLGSAIVPLESMPAGVRWFAECQPFAPIIETLRGQFTRTPVGATGLVAVAWWAALALVGYGWARARSPRT
ncbi:hypothetical protein ACIBI9_43400 [Nonomuraea sp. NPDC050451]|uniref:hypothetical protein n=1 Tax=Nonomuraea sp. NPDC050451 TaxID=3364364 RepID=UPI0037AEBD19